MDIPSTETNLMELIRNLQSLGFSDYEAKAYISLLKVQPATAYEVSKEAGIPKANCYTVLESLSKRDSVQPISEGPMRYVAVPPEILFDRIARSTEQRCNLLIEDLKMIGSVPDYDYVWSLSGKEPIDQAISQLIKDARHQLWVKATDTALMAHLDELRNCAGRGVIVRIILFGDDPEPFQFGGENRCWLHEGNGIAVGISHMLVTIARDYEEAIVAEFGKAPHASVTRNRALVNMVDSLIRHEIYFAEIFEVFGEQVMERFGPALYNLRCKYLPKQQVEDLSARLSDIQRTKLRTP